MKAGDNPNMYLTQQAENSPVSFLQTVVINAANTPTSKDQIQHLYSCEYKYIKTR